MKILQKDDAFAVFDPPKKMGTSYDGRLYEEKSCHNAFRWSQGTQSHSGKQGLLQKDDFNLTISSEVDDHKSGAIVRLK